jgi:hypothetical protein
MWPYINESVNRVYESLFCDNVARPALLAATNLMHHLVDTPLTQTR